MTTEEKFNAAVNVIRSLPKNGSYQPSNDLMLKFYAFFKQGTLGPCTGSRPPFWDVVGRAKYDAWKKLGDMSKKEAMKRYVDELHSIVETMSYSDKVANFLEAPTDELDSLNMDDLELIAGDVIQRVRSQTNSPIISREGSPIRFGGSSSNSSIPAEDTDHSDEEYIDTIENPEPRKFIPNGVPYTNSVSDYYKPTSHRIDVSQEISTAVQSLRSDIEKLTNKVNVIEKQAVVRRGFFNGLSPQLIAFIVIWPFVVSLVMRRFLINKV